MILLRMNGPNWSSFSSALSGLSNRSVAQTGLFELRIVQMYLSKKRFRCRMFLNFFDADGLRHSFFDGLCCLVRGNLT
jgi:hypothetical protein